MYDNSGGNPCELEEHCCSVALHFKPLGSFLSKKLVEEREGGEEFLCNPPVSFIKAGRK